MLRPFPKMRLTQLFIQRHIGCEYRHVNMIIGHVKNCNSLDLFEKCSSFESSAEGAADETPGRKHSYQVP